MRRAVSFIQRVSSLVVVAAVLCVFAAPATADQSVGKTATDNARHMRHPDPVTDLVVTAVDAENGKLRLRHESKGYEHWFELTDDTVIRSAENRKQVLHLSDVEAGSAVSVFVGQKLFGGKTVYVDVAAE